MSGSSEQVNGRPSGPILMSRFKAVLNHSEVWCGYVKSVNNRHDFHELALLLTQAWRVTWQTSIDCPPSSSKDI